MNKKIKKPARRPANYISKQDRKKKLFNKKPVQKTKRAKIKDLETMLDYQVERGEGYAKGTVSRNSWLEKAGRTRERLRKLSW